jgi:hypothetical protein
MAKGFGFVNRAAAEVAARSGGSSLWAGKLIFKLPNDGDTAFVRFVTTDDDGDFVHSAWHHEVPVEGRAWGDQVPCIAQDEDGNRTDDDCPGCEADLPMKFKGYVLVLWRDGPVYKTDDKGKVVKDNTGDPVVLSKKDQIAIWSSGPRLFEALGETDESYHGLGSRDFRVKRKGEGTKTEYFIVPADIDGGKKPMSAADKKLVKECEIDLSEFIKPPSYEAFKARLEGRSFAASGNGSGGSSQPATTAAGNNPFKRN